MKRTKKVFKIIGASLASIVGVFIIFVLCLALFRPVIYKDFLAKGRSSVEIPGLNMKYCPQGVTYVESHKTYLFTGYMQNKTASKLFAVSNNGANTMMLSLYEDENTPILGHVGGISSYRDKVYISDDGGVWVYSLDDILNSKNNDNIIAKDFLEVHNNASFTFADDYYLYVGEFYLKGKYDTKESNHIERGNEKSRAIVEAFAFNDSLENRVDTSKPEFVMSLPNEVQGFAVTSNGTIALSISYSIKSSNLLLYKSIDNKEKDYTLQIGENVVPGYFLGKDELIKKIDMMPMSEDLDYYNGQLIINFESACKKYKYFNVFQTKNIYLYQVA